MARGYEGKEITVYFDPKKCIHSRNCLLGLPGVFRAGSKGAWIDPDAAPAAEVAALIQTCPSGALTYRRPGESGGERPSEVNLVRILENGPLALRGALEIKGEPPLLRATLCRCGASKNKPWCDGSHREAGFVATGEPATGEASPLPRRDGPLAVTPLKNGPLLVEGNLEIISGTGRTVLRSTKTTLCRCGGSEKKPFCDGSHGRLGFSAG